MGWDVMMLRAVIVAILALGFAGDGAAAQNANDIENFYKGKNVTLVVGTGPGGAYDIHGRLIGRHIGKHIPGTPKLIVQNLPGAGSVTACNYVYNVAPKDGSVLANILNTVPLVYALGQVKTQFDPAKFQWIGNMTQEVYLVLVWHTSPAQSIEEAKHVKVLMGSTSPGSLGGMYPRVLNDVLGTQFQPIAGYKEATAIDLAVERGEVHGRAGESWYGQKGTTWEWTRAGKAKIILQIGFRKADDLKDVPLLLDLVKDDPAKRRLVELFSSPARFGKPTVVAPGVPAARVAALREAYAQTMTDPEFRADADKLGIDIQPVSGVDLGKLAESFASIPEDLLVRARHTVEN
jgi:tripartite-type tricarboxylate transporter receptor subunit TctC